MNGSVLLLTSAMLGLLLTVPVSAEIINTTQWKVQSGDTVYSIARKVFPDDSKKQAQFRRELIKQNPQVFEGNANLMSVGSILTLPDFAIARSHTPPAKPAVAAKVEMKAPEVVEKPAMVTPDPEDTIGRVIIATGEMEAENRGSIRKLTRNSSIFIGDSLRTRINSRSQIRMKDGALIALNPNTDVQVEDYRFNGVEDGSERSVFKLLRGGFRTITGLIGHTNKRNYQVKTSVATIGIRGTHYGLNLCEAGSCSHEGLSDGLYGGIVDGSITASNQSGEFKFTNDQYFHIQHITSKPTQLLVPPRVIGGDLPRPMQEHQGDDEQRGVQSQRPPPRPMGPPPPNMLTDKPPLPPKPPEFLPGVNAPDGSGFLYAFNGPNNGVFTGSAITASVRPDVVRVIPYANNGTVLPLPVFVFEPVAVPSFLTRHIGFNAADPATLVLPEYGQLTSIGSASIPIVVNWGRWDATDTHIFEGPDDQPIVSNGFMHFAFSPNLTTPTQLGGLVGTKNYTNTLGNTSPTDDTGAQGTLNFFSVTADFTNRQVTSYMVNTTVNSNTYAVRINTPVPFTNLAGGFVLQTDTPCGSCNGQANMNFIGPSANGVISTYTISNGTNTVSGAVVSDDGG